jgi:hypothetical protein
MAVMAAILSRPISTDIDTPMSGAVHGVPTVEKSVGGGLRRDPCRCRFAGHPQALYETDENARGTRGLDTIGQLARRPRAGECIRHPGLHRFEKARNATTNHGILASQFHGCGHQQAAAPTIAPAGALDIAGKVHPQAVDRVLARVEFEIHPRQSIGNVAIKRPQEERMLVAKGGVEAAARELRRPKQVRQRRAVIAARPEHIHRAFDRGLHVESSGPPAGRLG